MVRKFCALGVALSCLVFSVSCAPEGLPSASSDGDAGAASFFEPVAPWIYVAKIKDLLIGLPPTDEEVQAVIRDPAALGTLIDQWTLAPEYHDKLLGFFRNAFQQGQVTDLDFRDQLPADLRNFPNFAVLIRSFQESFARTALELIAEGRPFSEVITTRRFMMTPPLLSLLAYMDSLRLDDLGGVHDATLGANPNFSVTIHRSGPSIPISQTLDPRSAMYQHWRSSIPVPATVNGQPNLPSCLQDPLVYLRMPTALLEFLFGVLPYPPPCNATYFGASQFTAAEFEDWRMVSFRQPDPEEQPTLFYDLPTLRTTPELVATIPRVGFFTTPAFFANWQTNTSNQARVTMNQTLIVALGASFDEENSITPVAETGLDKEHAAPGTTCYACHHTLDPMRDYFRQAYTLNYHQQTDPAETNQFGVFAFGNTTGTGKDIFDLADRLAAQPRFAQAWALKLCFWANSAPCSEDDPELIRIAAAFQASGFQWKVLLKEMLTSPLSTATANTKTFEDRGVVVNVTRRERLCSALSNRLAIVDACALVTDAQRTSLQSILNVLSLAVPDDGYVRGALVPVLANDPTFVFRAGTENLCRALADQVVDAANSPSLYSSKTPQAAIDDFISRILAITQSDPRASSLRSVLGEHYSAGLAAGLTGTNALKSTFVLACESPTSVARGL